MTACLQPPPRHLKTLLPLPDMPNSNTTTAYDFEFESIEGGRMPLSDFRGQALLIVNTASRCAFTLQYGPLRELYKKYGGHGFSIIGVPSDDFHQEPEGNKEIKQFCQTSYLVNFPMTSKVKVRGRNAHPFFQWAHKQGGWFSGPSWNFYKYLIGTDGQLISWHLPSTSPLSRRITARIEQQTGFKP
jgi:glutathione peroxidase